MKAPWWRYFLYNIPVMTYFNFLNCPSPPPPDFLTYCLLQTMTTKKCYLFSMSSFIVTKSDVRHCSCKSLLLMSQCHPRLVLYCICCTKKWSTASSVYDLESWWTPLTWTFCTQQQGQNKRAGHTRWRSEIKGYLHYTKVKIIVKLFGSLDKKKTRLSFYFTLSWVLLYILIY